ncbi:MAG: DMT family transporter [Candidatus Taylorbacteria bacterium]|nr:DMT family transporter [Candidatus Taylorbacteria bacterium]
MMGYLQVLGAVSIWAFFNGYLVKGIKTSGVGVGTWTAMVGILVSYLFFNVNSYGRLDTYQSIMVICLGIFAALNNALGYTAIKISIPIALLFHYLAPVFVPIWGLIFPIFYQPLNLTGISAIGIALVGMVFLTASSFQNNSWKLTIFGLGSAIFYSLEIVFSGYVSKSLHIPAETSAFMKLAFQAMIMPIAAIIFKESLKVENGKEWLKIILGGSLLYISFILFFSGAETVKSSVQLGVLGYIDRVGAIVLGAYFFKEKMSRNTVMGGLLILGAGILVLFQ